MLKPHTGNTKSSRAGWKKNNISELVQQFGGKSVIFAGIPPQRKVEKFVMLNRSVSALLAVEKNHSAQGCTVRLSSTAFREKWHQKHTAVFGGIAPPGRK